jgi:hypothetical protein
MRRFVSRFVDSRRDVEWGQRIEPVPVKSRQELSLQPKLAGRNDTAPFMLEPGIGLLESVRIQALRSFCPGYRRHEGRTGCIDLLGRVHGPLLRLPREVRVCLCRHRGSRITVNRQIHHESAGARHRRATELGSRGS